MASAWTPYWSRVDLVLLSHWFFWGHHKEWSDQSIATSVFGLICLTGWDEMSVSGSCCFHREEIELPGGKRERKEEAGKSESRKSNHYWTDSHRLPSSSHLMNDWIERRHGKSYREREEDRAEVGDGERKSERMFRDSQNSVRHFFMCYTLGHLVHKRCRREDSKVRGSKWESETGYIKERIQEMKFGHENVITTYPGPPRVWT